MLKRIQFVLPLVAAMAAVSIPVGGAGAATGNAHFTFSNRMVEVNQRVDAQLCASNGAKGDVVSYQEAFGTHRRWKAIFQRRMSTSNQCFQYGFAEKSLGQYQFRLELLSRGKKIALTGLKRLDVFGPIPLLQLQNSVGFGCGGGSNAVSSGGHLYQSFCNYQSSNSFSSGSYRSGSRSSCRSMTLSLIATDDTSGVSPNAGTATLQIQQSTLNPQNFTFADDTLTAEKIQLDGSQFQLDFSDTNTNANLYVVSTGTADCYTLTGAI